MCEKQIIFKNKRKPIYIEISNKDIAFCHYKNLCKYQKNNNVLLVIKVVWFGMITFAALNETN